MLSQASMPWHRLFPLKRHPSSSLPTTTSTTLLSAFTLLWIYLFCSISHVNLTIVYMSDPCPWIAHSQGQVTCSTHHCSPTPGRSTWRESIARAWHTDITWCSTCSVGPGTEWMRWRLRDGGCASPGSPQKIEITSSVHSKGNFMQRSSSTGVGEPMKSNRREETLEISNGCDYYQS